MDQIKNTTNLLLHLICHRTTQEVMLWVGERERKHTSIYVPIDPPSNKRRRITPGAMNCVFPIDEEDDFPRESLINRSLNSQTLYLPGVPLDREHVSALLGRALEEGATTTPLDEIIEEEAETEGEEENYYKRRIYCEDGSESDSDYDEDDCDEDYVVPPLDNNIRPQAQLEGSFRIFPLPQPLLPGPQLMAKIELMNLMVQHMMPLVAPLQ